MLTRFCRRTLISRLRPSNTNNVLLLQNPPPLLIVKKLISSTISNEQESFTFSYLINSVGMSPASASFVSKRVQFKSPTKTDAVIDLLKNHGFSLDQVSTMIRKWPQLVLAGPEKTLLPKLDYMYSIGVSHSDVVKILVTFPWILRRSLEKHIIPTVDFFRGFLQSDEKAAAVLRRDASVLLPDFKRNLKPNITTLKDNGVEDSKVAFLVHYSPNVLLTNVRRFNASVEKVKELGFNPKRFGFVMAVKALRQLNKSTWEKKVGIYRSWVWSEESIHKAFLKDPFCMLLSEDKVMATMNFFVNEVGFDSSFIAERPHVLQYSLEKRIIPRCLVHKALVLKGLIKGQCDLTSLLSMSTPRFQDKFLNRFLKEVPELMDIYEGKIRP